MTRGLSIIALALGACARAPLATLPVLGEVPAFSLTAETGQPFDRRLLDGQVWVADFIFTSCPGPCPRMSSLMREVQASVASMPGVKLVSFSVDPERDTPEALSAYARRYHAQAGRWFFLTGSRVKLHELKRDAFKLGSVDGSLNHSTRLVLVDGRGRIRGYYGTGDDSPVRRLVVDIRRILQGPA